MYTSPHQKACTKIYFVETLDLEIAIKNSNVCEYIVVYWNTIQIWEENERKKWESYRLAGSHSLMLNKRHHSKRYMLYDSIYCMRNQDIPCRRVRSRKGQERGFLDSGNILFLVWKTGCTDLFILWTLTECPIVICALFYM